LLVAGAGHVLAQARHGPKNAADQKLISIIVTGTRRFTPEEITAASGLQIGASASEQDFQNAVAHLGESGLFSNVAYSYSYSPAGTKLELQLADTAHLVPVRFEDFVWFSDQELLQKLHEHLPLFKGEAPPQGTFADRISDVLQALLLEHSASAVVNYVREGKDNGPVEALVFRVDNVHIRVHGLNFPGASPADLPALNAALAPLVDNAYVRSNIRRYVDTRVRPIYLERGFVKATFADPQAKVVHEGEDETLVDVALPIEPGRQYKLSKIEWTGDKAFPADKLQSLVPLPPGEPVNAILLTSDLEKVRKLYGTLGYMAARVEPEPEFDEAAGTVAYRLKVSEGDVYHMGDLDIRGVDRKTADRLAQNWTLRPGDPYNQSYPNRFAHDSLKLLTSNLEWSVSVLEAVNDQDKTVDVTLRYNLSSSR
jgi:outer membrane protein assembly factor BamA